MAAANWPDAQPSNEVAYSHRTLKAALASNCITSSTTGSNLARIADIATSRLPVLSASTFCGSDSSILDGSSSCPPPLSSIGLQAAGLKLLT
eukprot:CAMPEP_0184321900 /NCGR_PEP_ID=MMETSP1049-20130417/121794_1 /TAXON_ID=77928 /ORGANISM="Proteomonas sulcata, Strain CCMP704" /LENGTH=91 /DNA_ID=CAMNT_0026642875 /DNA_START=159 /DNA_END=431 /DNA_ORIENTATION=+